jgi:hypothetical protein
MFCKSLHQNVYYSYAFQNVPSNFHDKYQDCCLQLLFLLINNIQTNVYIFLLQISPLIVRENTDKYILLICEFLGYDIVMW